ncbi:type VI secretion system-associated FHA domain protein TagH [Methylosarcina fibrata]|uniref:type VI secretion system-associated FHA domain protein TagH n=1 Tax=Methylosarcina fibrata TaxID=105972 RepID=UPI000371317B|nr:type VI secretion system-associated FHA domain protein TagH [Methylosarcina fibrata]
MGSTLKLTSTHCRTGAVEIREATSETLQIGRSLEGNNWTLPDPDARISRKQCVIEHQDDCYFITDISNNGTFQNSKRLTKYARTQLKDGDVLTLCENPPVYEIRVDIQLPRPKPEPKSEQSRQTSSSSKPWWDNEVPDGPPSPSPGPQPPFKKNTSDILSARELAQSFYDGANLQNVAMADDELPALFFNLGQFFRLTIEGLNDLLQARNSVKQGFHIPSHTMIGGGRLNPIKNMATEQAMEQLLVHKLPNCLGMPQALGEVFTDLQAHELAIMAGIQEALNFLVEEFDPHRLESRLSERMMIENLFPDISKVRYWNEYVKFYASIADETKTNFQKLFGDSFASAYDQFVDKLGEKPGDGS